MNPELKEAFTVIKPICDALLKCPSPANVAAMINQACSLKKNVLQDMHLYVLFPIVTYLNSSEIRNNHSQQKEFVDAMKVILEKITITAPEIFIKYHSTLFQFLYNKPRINVVSDIPEELKLSIVDSLNILMLNVDMDTRLKIHKKNILTLAHTIFLTVEIAKTEKLRSLKKSGIISLLCYTATHKSLTNATCQIKNKQLEEAVLEVLSAILPGVLAALQDVATSTDNPGYGVVVLSLNAIQRIVRVAMNDKFLKTKQDVSIEDFASILQIKEKEKQALCSDKDQSRKRKELARMTPEWFFMAGEKLKLVVRSLVVLQTHDNVKVRKELAELCGGLLIDCSRTMQPSMKYVLNILITLSKDEYPEVSKYCTEVLDKYFDDISSEAKRDTLDKVGESFLEEIARLDTVLNDIDSSSKLAMLNLLSGYISILTIRANPERLTTVLSQNDALPTVCEALVQAANVDTTVSLLEHAAVKAVVPPLVPPRPPWCPPWCPLPLLPCPPLYAGLATLVQMIANSPAAELVADELMNMLRDMYVETPALLRLLNWIGGAPNCPIAVTKRILSKYIEHEFWYLPLEVSSGEEPITREESLDPDVYNPRAWEKDSVPGLYEGAIEVRYTDISYSHPRQRKLKDPNHCSTLSEAQRNLVISCLLTEGVGLFAKRLGDAFQPYMMKVMCMILERVGSKNELLHLSGTKTLNEIAETFDHPNVGDLIKSNSDYFTFQITMRLKKSWNNRSALEILSVVMEYSDVSILDCLYGIVVDVLTQNCDKYHNNLTAYLQVMLTLVICIKKWFPSTVEKKEILPRKINVISETIEYIRSQNRLKRAMGETSDECDEDFDEKFPRNDEDDHFHDGITDYDDEMITDKPPLPKHIDLVIIIVKLCINFIPSKQRDKKLLALQIIDNGLQILNGYEDQVLPLVHLIWSPLTDRFEELNEPVVLRKSFELLITMAMVSKYFIRQRTLKDVIPNLKKFMESSSKESYLKDVGSAYRLSAAYKLQETILEGLPVLVVDLSLENEHFDNIIEAVDPYLSSRQPKPLQALAVKFYRKMLQYDRGSVWHHLREICNNNIIKEPPSLTTTVLDTIIGTPYKATDKTIDMNIKAIFDVC